MWGLKLTVFGFMALLLVLIADASVHSLLSEKLYSRQEPQSALSSIRVPSQVSSYPRPPEASSASTTLTLGWMAVWTKHVPVDPNTLTFLYDTRGMPTFAKDKNHVYFCCYPEGAAIVYYADPTSFTLLGTSDYYEKDNKHIYVHGIRLGSADPLTFKTLHESPYYAKDAYYIYYYDTIMSDSDPATFHLYDALAIYAADKNHVYWDGHVVPDANPQTFTPLPVTSQSATDSDGQYAKDPYSHQIYFQDHVLAGADFETFSVIPSPSSAADATDKNHLYKNGSVTN